MARCSACDIPARAALDRALVIGTETVTDLARRYDLSRQAILRHRAAHLPKALLETAALGVDDRGAAMLAEIEGLKDNVSELLNKAKTKGDLRGAVTAIREGTRLVELIAKLRGDLTPAPAVQINVVQTADFQAVSARILAALDPYPAARVAVVAALGASHQ